MTRSAHAAAPPAAARVDASGVTAPIWRTGLEALASLKLTVALFALSIVLVLAGTLAQVDQGIWIIMSRYFRAWWVPIEFGLFFPRDWKVPYALPFPGGWTLGGLLLANLLAAHALRFKIKARGGRLYAGLGLGALGTAVVLLALSGRGGVESFYAQLVVSSVGSLILLPASMLLFNQRAGVVLLHAGIIVMLVSELLTGLYAREANMVLEEGSFANHISDSRHYELAFIDASDPARDRVVVVPQELMQRHKPRMSATGEVTAPGEFFSHPLLPVRVRIDAFYSNATLEGTPGRGGPAKPDRPNLATRGAGREVGLRMDPRATGTGEDNVEYPAAYVTFETPEGGPIGTHMLSCMWNAPVDEFEVGGRKWKPVLRFRREYLPFEVHLSEARHDVFTGTDIPRNFSSRVRIEDRERGRSRDALISMNNPLRYRGETMFQFQMAAGEGRSVLQVVRNPAWGGPYVSCVVVALGMLMHFGLSLGRFVDKQLKQEVVADAGQAQVKS